MATHNNNERHFEKKTGEGAVMERGARTSFELVNKKRMKKDEVELNTEQRERERMVDDHSVCLCGMFVFRWRRASEGAYFS